MNRLRVVVSALAATAFLMLLPTVARAQSAIGGTVKDTTGAVMPGSRWKPRAPH